MTIVQERYEVGEPSEGSDLYDIIGKPAWMRNGACIGWPQQWWYVERGGDTARAKAICAACPVKGECLTYALDNAERHGIWGGKSEHQRRRMRR